MGNNSSSKKLNPKTVEELKRNLDVEFSKEEIQEWYKEFRKYLRRGNTHLDKSAFVKVYNSLFCGDASEFAEHVFRTFDQDENRSVDFQEFILGLCISGSDNAEKKLKWAFDMYDIDKNGFISKEEMTKIIKAICKMTRSDLPPELKSPEHMTSKVFDTLDKDSDNQISQQEFLEGAHEVQFIIDILQCDPDS